MGLLNSMNIIALDFYILIGDPFSSYDFIGLGMLGFIFFDAGWSKVNFLFYTSSIPLAFRKFIVFFIDSLCLLNESI